MRRVLPVLAACLLLAGCSAPTVALTPAPDATAVGCASVIVGTRGIQQIGLAEKRNTDAQGTAAWGQPASVTLTCGVRTPEVSSLPCFTVDEVNWLRRTVGDRQVLVTYGRTPGVELVVTDATSVSDAVQALSEPVAEATEATDRRCVATSEGTPTPVATPAATP